MKNLTLVLILNFAIYMAINAQIKVQSNGYIGLGTTTPSTNVEVYAPVVLFKGSASTQNMQIQFYNNIAINLEPVSNNTGYLGATNRWYCGKFNQVRYLSLINESDERIKENIKDIPSALDKVIKLHGVTYDLKESFMLKNSDPKMKDKLMLQSKNQIGLIAQEVKEIIPEIVSYDSIQQIYGIEYVKIIPVLIEAIKEQNAEIVKLKQQVSKGLKSAEEPLFTENVSQTTSLAQNVPNPFTENTSIAFYISKEIVDAVLYIYDLQGKQIKSIKITERGQGSKIINANELQVGMYKYALVTDGQIVGVETMILTK